jgi:hypothetical protein
MTKTNNPEGRASIHAQYVEFAVQARAAAAVEKLDNVRQKHLKSAASWEQLAVTGRKTDELRTRRLVETLAAVAATEPQASSRLLLPQPGDAAHSTNTIDATRRTLIS